MSTTASAGIQERLGYQAALLGGFATLAGALLMGGHLLTRDAIALRLQEDLSHSLEQVLPPRLHDKDPTASHLALTGPGGIPVQAYRALRGQAVTGVALRLTAQGYAGAIDLVLGVDPEGRILGVRVLAHKETPGLGDHIDLAKDDWITRFAGKSLGDPPEVQWGVNKDGGLFDQFAGATITPRGVVKAIKEGLILFRAQRAVLLAPPAGTKIGVQAPTSAP
jgi:electron transport complex protein RnfG